MQIKVLLFGVLKDLASVSTQTISLPDDATVREVVEYFRTSWGQPAVLSSIAVAVNQEYSTLATPLRPGDEVALLPPVSGGAPRALITRQRIDSARVSDTLRQGEDGAVVLFEGIVRNHSRGRGTRYLEYEAYEPMAVKEMERLAEEALSKFQIRDVAIIHRLGHLDVGETSVLIVVVSAHRAAAFEACRWLIDTLKRKVPIWKKEFFEDGAVWADGEPFPESAAMSGAVTNSQTLASK